MDINTEPCVTVELPNQRRPWLFRESQTWHPVAAASTNQQALWVTWREPYLRLGSVRTTSLNSRPSPAGRLTSRRKMMLSVCWSCSYSWRRGALLYWVAGEQRLQTNLNMSVILKAIEIFSYFMQSWRRCSRNTYSMYMLHSIGSASHLSLFGVRLTLLSNYSCRRNAHEEEEQNRYWPASFSALGHKEQSIVWYSEKWYGLALPTPHCKRWFVAWISGLTISSCFRLKV